MKNIIKKDKKPKKDKPLTKSNVIDIASSIANIKSKDSNEILVLAPSELDYKPKKCQRCFYLEKNYKIGPKDFPPPVFSRFDVVQQAYYKDKNTSDLTKELPSESTNSLISVLPLNNGLAARTNAFALIAFAAGNVILPCSVYI